MVNITDRQREKLITFASMLIDQERAEVLVRQQKDSDGFWVGSGNMIEDKEGRFYLSGRYRNMGDSRLGLGEGERGLELAIFESTDRGKSFRKLFGLKKQDLSLIDQRVISIEGSSIYDCENGVELYDYQQTFPCL